MPTTPQPARSSTTVPPDKLFDLDVYRNAPSSTEANSKPETNADPLPTKIGVSDERPQRRILRIPNLVLHLACLFAIVGMANVVVRFGCYGDLRLHAVAFPSFVCEAVSPSQSQFWDLVLADTLQHIPSRKVSQQVAVLRHSLPIPRRIDYALRGNGARILQDFTTATHTPASQKNHNLENLNIGYPSIVLEEQVLVGDCWEFSGPSGHIGIRLSERVNITSLSLIQPDRRRILPVGTTKAPQSFTVWCLVDAAELSHDVLTSRVGIPPTKFVHSKNRMPSYIPPNHIFLPVFRGFYDIHSPFSSQTFDRDPLLAQYRTIVTQILIIEISSNWGGSTTCLYHFAVHGSTDFTYES